MAKKLIFIVCLFISIYPDGFCNAMNSGEEVNDKTLIEIKKQDNGKEFIVKPGDIIRIELVEMGAAGYSWFVDNLNTEYLEMLSRKTKSISEGEMGAPVLGEWLFRVKREGLRRNQYGSLSSLGRQGKGSRTFFHKTIN